MAIVENHCPVNTAKASELCGERCMIGVEVGSAAACDLRPIGGVAGGVQRFPVEGRRRTQLRGGLARIQGGTRGVAIGVDEGARKGGAHEGHAEGRSEIVEAIHPPVRIFASQPRRHEAAGVYRGNLDPRVRHAENDRRCSLRHGQPLRSGRFVHAVSSRARRAR